MHAIQLFGLIVGLGFAGAVSAQASMQSDDHRAKRKQTPLPYTPPPKPTPSTAERPYTPPTYRPRTERDYEPWRANRQPAPPKAPSSSRPKTQPVKSAAKPAEARDPALARCDAFKRRMEQVIREEQRGGDPARMQRLGEERKKIYQDSLRAGC